MKGASKRLLVLLAVTLLVYGAFGAYVLSRHKTVDFFEYYVAASLVAAGQSGQLYEYPGQAWVSASRAVGLDPIPPAYLYPPTLSLLVVPLTLAPPSLAAGIWFFLSLLLLGLSVFSILRAWGIPLVSDLGLTLVFLALWLVPSLVTLHAGQVNFMILFLLAMAAAELRRGRLWTSGVAIGVAAAIKVFPVALLAYFLWKRDLKVFIGGVVAGGASLTLALPFVGVGTLLTYAWEVLPSLFTSLVADPPNQSLTGFVARLGPMEGARTWVALGAGAVILVTVLACSVNRAFSRPTYYEFSAVLVGTLLVSAISWEHYLVLLALPAWLMTLEALGQAPSSGFPWTPAYLQSHRLRTLAGLALVYLLVNIQGLAWHWLVEYPLLLSLGFYGTLLLWLLLVGNLFALAYGRGLLSRP